MVPSPGTADRSFSAAPGKITVSAALRVMGLGQTEQFQRYHRVLNRAIWSGREASCVLLGLLVKTFVPSSGPLVIGVDETLERRKPDSSASSPSIVPSAEQPVRGAPPVVSRTARTKED